MRGNRCLLRRTDPSLQLHWWENSRDTVELIHSGFDNRIEVAYCAEAKQHWANKCLFIQIQCQSFAGHVSKCTTALSASAAQKHAPSHTKDAATQVLLASVPLWVCLSPPGNYLLISTSILQQVQQLWSKWFINVFAEPLKQRKLRKSHTSQPFRLNFSNKQKHNELHE